MIAPSRFLSNSWERALRECGIIVRNSGICTHTKNYQKTGREGGERTQFPLQSQGSWSKEISKAPRTWWWFRSEHLKLLMLRDEY